VVLLGPTHRVPLRGLAVSSLDGFETPLGTVPIDAAGRQRLREFGLAGIADAPHAAEHSLEVQLPFLQSVLDDFDLLPIAAGLAPPDLVARALDAVWGGDDTLIVVSSDLSHYHTSDEARQLDATTTRAILERRSDVSDEQACGASGINGLMQVARHRGLIVELLDQRNSGDTAGDRARVVGYGSYALFEA
jgi:AmmeMemoRadiSam system protein B